MDFSKFDAQVNNEEMAKQIEEAKNNPQQTDKQVPAGNYTVRIEKMELAATKDGRPMFKVQCRIWSCDKYFCYTITSCSRKYIFRTTCEF